jgi:hypothetical protein
MNERGLLTKIVGGQTGGILISGTDAVTGEFDAIVINEDAVFDELEADEIDVLEAHGLDGGQTLTAGMFLGPGAKQGVSVPALARFTTIKLTSGSVIAY